MKLSAGITAAPQDVSLPIFRSLKAKGYKSTRWHTNAGATDVPCLSKDGDVQDLNSFLFGLQHAAPIYEKTHVGCKCTIEVTAKGKPSVMVNAFGIVQGDIDTTPTEAVEELPAKAAEEVDQDVEVAESNSKTPRKTADQWKKMGVPKAPAQAPAPKAEPKKTEKKPAGSSRAVPVNEPGKATKAKVGQLVKKVLDVK
jgi:hypothetical protein